MKQATTIILNAGKDIATVLHTLEPTHKRHVSALLSEIVITAATIEGLSRDELVKRLAHEFGEITPKLEE
jgi:hypothetical protein